MDIQPAATVSVIPPFPMPADRATNTYNSKALAFGLHMGPPGPFVGEMNALTANVAYNAGAAKWFAERSDESRASAAALAAAAETSAQNAAGISGAPMWAPGNYEFGDFAWSPTSLLTYRRSVPGVTASAADPATGPASGWKLSNSAMSMPQQELAGAGPHQLLAGMHYIVLHPFAVLHMPDAAAQEQVRIEDRSGGITVQVWPAAGDTFKGQDVALLLSTRGFDHTFTKTIAGGWS